MMRFRTSMDNFHESFAYRTQFPPELWALCSYYCYSVCKSWK